MFMLTTVNDNIRVHPEDITAATAVSVENEIRKLYFDKVLPAVGLVVSLYDILNIEGGLIHSGDGGAHFKVEFRLVVFRPFEGEIIVGQILESSPEGVSVDLGFFRDIFVPEQYMQSPGSMYDSTRRCWFWKYDTEVLWLEKGESLRFKVREVRFAKVPTPAEAAKLTNKASGAGAVGTEANPFQAFHIIGDIDGDGLGCLSWWEGAEEDAMEEG